VRSYPDSNNPLPRPETLAKGSFQGPNPHLLPAIENRGGSGAMGMQNA